MPDSTFALHVVGRTDAVLHVVPDAKYADMWRVAYPDGTLSDFANLSRARDAAAAVALGMLNRRLEREAA
jgi:hypothetical protein